jgi:Spy/CpxP family protein refolding chaperone
MLRKLILGLAATASLSTIALAPTAASAKPFGWGWGFHHHHFGGGIGYIGGVDEGCYVTRTVLTPFGYRLRTVNICY